MRTADREKLIKELETFCGLPPLMLTRLNTDELQKLHEERMPGNTSHNQKKREQEK